MSDRATPLPTFNLDSIVEGEPNTSGSTAPTPARSSSFLQVPPPALPHPQRPKAPSVRLSYRDESEPNTNSIYRRERSATVGAQPWSWGRSTPTPEKPEQPETASDGGRAGEWDLPRIAPGGGRETASTAAARGPGRRRALSSAMSWWGGSSNGDAEDAVDPDSDAGKLKEQRERHDRQVIDLLDVIGARSGLLWFWTRLS